MKRSTTSDANELANAQSSDDRPQPSMMIASQRDGAILVIKTFDGIWKST